MMLNLMEQFPHGEYGFHSTRALHVMIEAKKLAYADMLRYVGDPKFAKVPVEQMLTRSTPPSAPSSSANARRLHVAAVATCGRHRRQGKRHDLHDRDRQGRQHRLAHPEQLHGVRLRPGAARHRLHAAEPRLRCSRWNTSSPTSLAGHKRPLHTIIPAFMQKGDVRIGFGIMGGWNQAQAHAQFVANIVDYGMNIQQALEAGRFTKATFDGCDVEIEELVPEERCAANGTGTSGQDRPAAHSDFRLRPGGDEQRHGRALRRQRSASRRRGHPGAGTRIRSVVCEVAASAGLEPHSSFGLR